MQPNKLLLFCHSSAHHAREKCRALGLDCWRYEFSRKQYFKINDFPFENLERLHIKRRNLRPLSGLALPCVSSSGTLILSSSPQWLVSCGLCSTLLYSVRDLVGACTRMLDSRRVSWESAHHSGDQRQGIVKRLQLFLSAVTQHFALFESIDMEYARRRPCKMFSPLSSR